MAAALQAAWGGAAVTLFERNPAVGRKLLVTGSGRCNITNDAVSAAKYACADPAWMETLLKQFGVPDLLEMLDSIGIPVHKTEDGWYYPLSNSAQSVVEAFSSALTLAGVTLVTECQVSSLHSRGKRLAVRFWRDGKEQEDEFERVIVSAGGKAYPSLGSRGELFPVLERLGHTVLPKRPALAPLLADLGRLRPLQGMRLNAGVTLWQADRRLGETKGNLIFTEWGLNGPAVMDLSHLVSARPGLALELSLDALAFFREEFERGLARHRAGRMPAGVFLGGYFPPKVALTFLKNARLPDDAPLGEVDERSLARLVEQLTDTRLAVKGVRDFETCQVSAGGVPTAGVNGSIPATCIIVSRVSAASIRRSSGLSSLAMVRALPGRRPSKRPQRRPRCKCALARGRPPPARAGMLARCVRALSCPPSPARSRAPPARAATTLLRSPSPRPTRARRFASAPRRTTRPGLRTPSSTRTGTSRRRRSACTATAKRSPPSRPRSPRPTARRRTRRSSSRPRATRPRGPSTATPTSWTSTPPTQRRSRCR